MLEIFNFCFFRYFSVIPLNVSEVLSRCAAPSVAGEAFNQPPSYLPINDQASDLSPSESVGSNSRRSHQAPTPGKGGQVWHS